MKLHRFIGPFDLKRDILEITDEDFVHQVKNVLKLRLKERIGLCDGYLNDASAFIIGIDKRSIRVRVEERTVNQAESPVDAELYCAILKRDNFDLVIQKATELGICRIIPLVTARTIKTDIKPERLSKIAKEAAELSGRGVVPTIAEPLDLKAAIEQSEDERLNILFDAGGRGIKTIKELASATHIAGWVGPEGGWSDEERDLALESGFKIASLGPRVLRGETAAIVVSHILSQP